MRRARIEGLATALALGLALGACSRVSPRPCAVLVTLDTTRADAIGCFGGRPGVAPVLDALSRECVVYTAARTVAPVTLPAHASMLTGLIPPRHTVRDNALRPLPADARTLAEIAREHEHETAAFVAASVLERAWGLAQGFETYDQPTEARSGLTAHIGERRSAEVVRAAVDWLGGRDEGEPYFLWVHLFDPHAPYEPERTFLDQAGGDAYLGEVAAMDHEVGVLLDALRSDPAWDRTTMVVVADHGESLGQHGEPTHSIFCYRPVLRVPMLVRHPDGRRAGERSPEVVSVVDVFPTIAEALGLSVPDGIDGISLAWQSVPDDRGVYFESYVGYLNYGWSPIVGLADARGVFMQSGAPELYAAEGDWFEKANRAPAEPEEIARYRSRIAELASRPPLQTAGSGEIDEETLARVRSLGYAGAGDPAAALPDPLADTGRPSPRDRLGELGEYYAAVLEANAGRSGTAIAKLEAVVAGNPGNIAALDVLGALLLKEKRHADAIRTLERVLAIGPNRATTWTSLGQCHEALGDLERALRHYREAAELVLGGAAQIRDVVRVLESLGRAEEARPWRERLPATR